MITYRQADIGDIPVISQLRLQFLQEVYPQADTSKNDILLQQLDTYLREYLPKGDFVNWLALDRSEAVASAGIVFYNQPPLYHNLEGKVAYILNVYTLPAYRRRGIAHGLFERIVEEARRRNTGKLSLHTTPDGRSLYEQFGFLAGDNEMTCQMSRMQ